MEDSQKDSLKNSSSSVDVINGVSFTPREIDILACIAGGRTAKKIAFSLSLSPRTVENYTRNIMLKIECNSRESIIDFLEKSDKILLLRQRYSALFSSLHSSVKDIQFVTKKNFPSLTEKSLSLSPSKEKNKSKTLISYLYKAKKKLLILSVLLLSFIIFCGLWVSFSQRNNKADPEQYKVENSIRSDLIIPTDSSLLQRPELIAQLNEKFNDNKGIQTVSLVGSGGAGKTTLARQYAHQQKAPVVWEINAETYESLKSSFESLAQALINTEEDQKILREIQDIKVSEIRETKIIQFVKDRLRRYPRWFLIFDNVEKFSDIQKWFPQDVDTWGSGKILLTTRDSTLGNNARVNHMIFTGELTPHQKLSLFTKIMNHETKQLLTATQTEEAKTFLESIPPFPLDVSVAAYYLKAANIPYTSYLENLKGYNKDFETVQEMLLKETGDYTRTRYGIIILSVQNLIKAHKDFQDLLLFISLLDSQNIPRALLESYKDKTVVDNFIYHLKKYSLITNNFLYSNSKNSVFSLHRSTQSIILAYLTEKLKLKKDDSNFQRIIDTLEKYVFNVVHKEDVPKMSLILSHCERVLKHDDLLPPSSRALIKGELGSIYFYLNRYKEAQVLLHQAIRLLNETKKNPDKLGQFLSCLASIYITLGDGEKSIKYHTESVATFQKYFPDNYLKIGLHLTYLGSVYRDIGEYKKSKNILEKAHSIFKNESLENRTGFARNLVDLGKVYRSLGYYEKARVVLEKGFALYKKSLPKDHFRNAWAAIYLANTLNDLEKYKEAQELLEASFQIYKKNFSDTHKRMAWLLASLGHTYEGLGQYKKAKELLEKSLENLSEPPFEVAWVLTRLGNVCLKLEDIENAKRFFEKSLIILENIYGKDHVETARVLKDLGHVYLIAGHIEIADDLISKAIKIFQKNNHPDLFLTLETKAEVYVKKSTLKMREEGDKQPKDFKAQAIHYFEKALLLAKVYFLKDSPHIARIQTKLNALLPVLK